MKKLPASISVGFFLNLSYAVFILYFWTNSLEQQGITPLGHTLILGIRLFIICGLIIQLVSVFCCRLLPKTALFLGAVASVPFFPIGTIFTWGLFFNQQQAHYAAFEKTLTPPQTALQRYSFARQNTFFILGFALILSAGGLLLVHFLNLFQRVTIASACLLVALQCVFIWKYMARNDYLYILKDKLILFPSPGLPGIILPLSAIEKYFFSDNTLMLNLHSVKKSEQILIKFQLITANRRTEAKLFLRNFFQKYSTLSAN